MSASPPSCSPDALTEYAAGRLPLHRASALRDHLDGCARCRFALVDEENLRSLLSTGAPSMPGSLHASLLSLAAGTPAPARASASPGGARLVPPIPAPAHPPMLGHGMAPLPVLAPTAPPAHRSPLRSTVIAVVAAGAGVAAAWSLGVAATGSLANNPNTPATSRLPATLVGRTSTGSTTSNPAVNWRPSNESPFGPISYDSTAESTP